MDPEPSMSDTSLDTSLEPEGAPSLADTLESKLALASKSESEVVPSHAPEAQMLDVHPPHEAVHTWKDFFIHIATIVIGLLIAIGLEQAVEYVHHRELAAHTRETLAQEMDSNRELLRRNIYSLKMHQNYLFNDLPVIQRARTHSIEPSDLIVVWHAYFGFVDSAWQTAHESSAAGLLPYSELRQFARVYRTQDFFNTLQTESAVNLQRAATVFYHGAADRFDNEKARRNHTAADDSGENGEAAAHAAFEEQAPGAKQIAKLTSDQLDRLEMAIQQGVYDDDRLINFCTSLQIQYDALKTAAGND
jgi:hypothetical protein